MDGGVDPQVEIQRLREKVRMLEDEVARLLPNMERQWGKNERGSNDATKGIQTSSAEKVIDDNHQNVERKLSKLEISRYGRQLILPEIGIAGQTKMKNTAVLVVGAGGLGSPVTMYLASSGIGRIGVVDYDDVELGNLHRQIIHDERKIKMSKVHSAVETIQRMNSECQCIPYNILLDSSNAMEIIRRYDIIVDATDNVATRYLLNDCCVLLNKVLVSGSALRMEGQLTVYNHGEGPCFRCLFPKPPPPETVTNCSDGGVLGVVPGVIGTIQALEVIKIAAGLEPSYSQKMLLFDAVGGTFRVVKLRGRSKTCVINGENPTITSPVDYVQFCRAGPNDKTPAVKILDERNRITCLELHRIIDERQPHLIVDVRDKVQYQICSLPNSINIPLSHLTQSLERIKERSVPVYFICRRGNDSQVATSLFNEVYLGSHSKDVIGGLARWSIEVDPDFPCY